MPGMPRTHNAINAKCSNAKCSMKEAAAVWGVPRRNKSDIQLNGEDSSFRHLAFMAFVI
jgi:hypothetical protein